VVIQLVRGMRARTRTRIKQEARIDMK